MEENVQVVKWFINETAEGFEIVTENKTLVAVTSQKGVAEYLADLHNQFLS